MSERNISSVVRINACRAIFAALSIITAITAIIRHASAAEKDAPILTIVLERTELLANQSLAVRLWIENPTDFNLEKVSLRFFGPGYIHLGQPGTSGCIASSATPIPLPALKPNSALDSPTELCLGADATVEERDINVAFSLFFELKKQDQIRSGMLVSEKKLGVGLFGTETVAGVSFRLAAYFLPGVLLLMILRLGSVPKFNNLTAVESAALSVLVSVLLSTVAASLLGAPKLSLPGTGPGVSATQFVVVCGLAAFLGALATIVCATMHWWGRYQQRALLISTTDTLEVILSKALRSAQGSFAPVSVVTKEDTTYVGSLCAETQNGGVVLLAWFEVRPTRQQGELRGALNQHIRQKEFQRALKVALDNGLEPKVRNQIRWAPAGGKLQPWLAANFKRFDRNEIRSRSTDPVPNLDADDPPLVIA